jgi:CRP-like cAMP-binding protein
MSKRRVSTVRPPPSLGPPSSPRSDRPGNRLLASLPPLDFARIARSLETIPLSAKQVLLKRGDPIHNVFFPNAGVCSVTAMMKSGAAVEVATVGDEGMLGISAFFGAAVMPGESMVQVFTSMPPMTAERMTIQSFRVELERRGALYDAVQRYSQGTIALIMQSTACMALHHVQERCCRWLLMTQDRVRASEFTLSQEFLAMMLGASRPTVTLVARSLQDKGLIRYTHARMAILDRRRLEQASCECYASIKTEFERLGL